MDKQLTSGSVLSQTFDVFSSNFFGFGTICALLLIPGLVVQIYLVQFGMGAESEIGFDRGPFIWLLLLLVMMLMNQLAVAALCYGVFQVVRGRSVSIPGCLAAGLARLGSVLAVSVLAGIVIFAGFLVLIVPGIIAYVVLAVAVPATVIENAGVVQSLKRSSELTGEYRWTVFGVLFTLILLNLGAQKLIELVAPWSTWTFIALWWVESIVYTGLGATAAALLYYRLRNAKESIDVDEIAAVFD